MSGISYRMIPTEDASARKREIEEKLKQVRHGWRGRKHHKRAFQWLINQTGLYCLFELLFIDKLNVTLYCRHDRSESAVVCVMLQEQETLSFIRENLEKSDQLTKGMV